MLELLVPDRGEKAKYFLDEENLSLIKVKERRRTRSEKAKNDKKAKEKGRMVSK